MTQILDASNGGPDPCLETLLADFLGEATELLDRLNDDVLTLDEWVSTSALRQFRCDVDLMNRMFRSAHSIKGLSAMFGLQNINSLTHKIENVLDAARTGDLQFNRQSVDVVFRSLDALAEMILQLQQRGHDEYDLMGIAGEIQGVLQGAAGPREPEGRIEGIASSAAQPFTAAGESPARPSETLRVDIERLDQLLNLAGRLAINKARLAQIGERLRGAMPSGQSAQGVDLAARLAQSILAEIDQQAAPGSSAIDAVAIRSSVLKLCSELANLKREADRTAQASSCAADMVEAVQELHGIADGIQKCVTSTRLAPIGPLLGRFKRVVRDITRSSGKEIRLEVLGERTELDKRVIDALGEPLIHLVRNSADHGIEPPEARQAAGKPRQGVITLSAQRSGDSFVIEVRDDGKGLDHDKILAKAIERGIVAPIDAENLTPHQIYQLIWEPGFSTADQVTDISGRGIGMDVVRAKIEELNGAVEVASSPGAGAAFRIKLPLTLASWPCLLAEIEGDVFALPLESVVEVAQLRRGEPTSIDGTGAITIRGRDVAVVNLNEALAGRLRAEAGSSRISNDQTLVIVGRQGREIGVPVDQLLGEENLMIHSPGENRPGAAGIAGASILADGRVSFLLDIAALIEMSLGGNADAFQQTDARVHG